MDDASKVLASAEIDPYRISHLGKRVDSVKSATIKLERASLSIHPMQLSFFSKQYSFFETTSFDKDINKEISQIVTNLDEIKLHMKTIDTFVLANPKEKDKINEAIKTANVAIASNVEKINSLNSRLKEKHQIPDVTKPSGLATALEKSNQSINEKYNR